MIQHAWLGSCVLSKPTEMRGGRHGCLSVWRIMYLGRSVQIKRSECHEESIDALAVEREEDPLLMSIFLLFG